MVVIGFVIFTVSMLVAGFVQLENRPSVTVVVTGLVSSVKMVVVVVGFVQISIVFVMTVFLLSNNPPSEVAGHEQLAEECSVVAELKYEVPSPLLLVELVFDVLVGGVDGPVEGVED